MGGGRSEEIMSPSVLLLLPLLWRLFNRPISMLGRVTYYKSYNEEPLEIAGCEMFACQISFPLTNRQCQSAEGIFFLNLIRVLLEDVS